jgi:hypothetical protein
MNGVGIAVIAHSRPDYLYITLDGLRRARGIEDHMVHVFFDGGLTMDIIRQQVKAVGCFPGFHMHFHNSLEPTGILISVLRALGTLFGSGFERIFYLEDDHLVRPDILEVIDQTEQHEPFLCLSDHSDRVDVDYRAKGNVIAYDDFHDLFDWIREGNYIGKPHKGDTILDENTTSHDAVFTAYVMDQEINTQFVHGFYVAHFGLFGTNSTYENASEEALRIHKQMFYGPKHQWLENIVEILQAADYSDDLRLLLWPKGFCYDGERPLVQMLPEPEGSLI